MLYLMLKMFMVTKSSRAADITTEIMLLQKQTTLLFLACRQPFTYFPFMLMLPSESMTAKQRQTHTHAFYIPKLLITVN